MSELIWVMAAVMAGNLLSVGLAAVIFYGGLNSAKALPWLISFAAGTLLSAGFLGMLPKAMSALPPREAATVIFAAIVLMILLEKTLLWRHCHEENCEIHRAAGSLVLFGDGLHNFMDGVAIAAAFSAGPQLGLATTAAIFAHELPQELGDFAVLLDSGFTKRSAIFWNLVSGAAALGGGLAGWYAIGSVARAAPYAMAVSGASFIYIALSDLIPSLGGRHRVGPAHFLAFLGGAGIMLPFILK